MDKNNMKLAVIGLRGIPDVMGGIETHCQELYSHWMEFDNSMNITVLCRSPYVGTAQNYKGIKTVPIWSLKSKFFETILHTFLSILYAKFIIKADIVHLHAIGPALYTPLAKLLGMKVVVTHHGADYNRQKWNGLAKSILKLGEYLGISFANKIIVVGKSLTEKLKKKYPKHADKIEYIPNGVSISVKTDKNYDINKLLNELKITSKKYILFVGRLVPEKGVSDLIAAYKKSKIEHKLLIVGTTDHKDAYYDSLIQENNESIIFAGFRVGVELDTLFDNASLFVLPSYHEGLPIALLEAIGHELPVIVSDISPNIDVSLPDNCYFKLGDIKNLSSKLNKTHFDEYQVEKNHFKAKFDWFNISKITLQEFQKVCL